MYRNESIELVYCIARLKGKYIGARKAEMIAEHFSYSELQRVYRVVKYKVLNGVSA